MYQSIQNQPRKIYYDTTKNSPGYTGSVKKVFYQKLVKLVIFIAVSSEGTHLVPAKRRRFFDPFPKAEGLTNGMPAPAYDNTQLKKGVDSV
mgnify:CR=1 FL=1